jgi:hypothetical protein
LVASGLKVKAAVSKPLLCQKVQNLQSRKLERVLFTDESLKFTAEIGLRFSEPFHSSLHSTFRHFYLCSNLLL